MHRARGRAGKCRRVARCAVPGRGDRRGLGEARHGHGRGGVRDGGERPIRLHPADRGRLARFTRAAPRSGGHSRRSGRRCSRTAGTREGASSRPAAPARAGSSVPCMPRSQIVLIEWRRNRRAGCSPVTARGTSPRHDRAGAGRRGARIEVLYRKGLKVFVDRVETIRLPPLSYYYAGSLPAAARDLDPRGRLAARGHVPAAADLPVPRRARRRCGASVFPSNYNVL